MNWKESALLEIRNHFMNKNFTASDVAKVLRNYSLGTIYRILNDLAREGKVTKIGYGIFSAKPRIGYIGTKERSFPPNLEKARELLSESGIRFMLTGYSVLSPFIHLFPRRAVYLVYVERGAGESAVEALEKGGFDTLLNPKNEREVNIALELTKGDLFVVRERRELAGNTESGMASVEKGLVDLYFESTRKRIPFPESEVGRIMLDAIKMYSLDLTRMTKLASRRGIDGEIRAILESEAGLHVRRGKTVMNEHVMSALSFLER
ncbi:MAG: DUF6577 family protein [Conexivisphaerales archaeon]